MIFSILLFSLPMILDENKIHELSTFYSRAVKMNAWKLMRKELP